jgi:hypothetical protein
LGGVLIEKRAPPPQVDERFGSCSAANSYTSVADVLEIKKQYHSSLELD